MLSNPLRLIVSLAISSATAASDRLAREMILTPHPGVQREDREIGRCQVRAAAADATPAAFEQLAWAYVAKARRSLDPGFYKLAERTVDVIEAEYRVTPELLLIRGHVCHNLHRFRDAERIARRVVAERGAPVDHALLSDALIEQGKLEEGTSALQRFVDLKPGAEAYSRISQVRWLRGDIEGAYRALMSALRATHSDDAGTRAWVLTRLSALDLQRGELESARRFAEAANAAASDYAPALLAQGRALLALERAAEAVAALRAAEKLQPLPEYQWWLADALRSANQPDEARQVEQRLLARGAEADARTLALFLATRGQQPANAIRLADAELVERQDVHTHDARAWALAAAGRLADAKIALRTALASGTKDPRLSLHAAEIALADGNPHEAREHGARAREGAGSLTPSERVRLERILSPVTDVAAK